MNITTSQPSEDRKRHGEHILIHMTYIAKNVDLAHLSTGADILKKTISFQL